MILCTELQNEIILLQLRAQRKDAIVMKIESSTVQMDATYSASKISVSETSETFSLASTTLTRNAANRSYSSGGKDSYPLSSPSTLIYLPANHSTVSIEEAFHDLNKRMLQYIIEMMHEMLKGNNFISHSRSEYLTSSSHEQRPNTQVWYRQSSPNYSFYSEQEATTFQTTGFVKTSDGRELSFSLEFSMSRSFMKETKLDTKMKDVVSMYDPLVINMDVPTAAVTNQSFFFDINKDGNTEQIHTLAKGSGFLALDKNGDGIINDGSELFGTKSGDGFKDLAFYDADNNGWIDESDAIFEELKVWTKDYDGSDNLISLKEADIGAIFLGNISTQFDLNQKETNNTLARIQSTGIFLHESTGNAGTIQHIDFSA